MSSLPKITAFLPCRKGSQRIPDKNLKKFSYFGNGLLELKLKQLFKCPLIDSVIVSSNDERVMKVTEEVARLTDYINVFYDDRPDSLGSSETTTDELIAYVAKKFKFDHLLWTHVTSPFVNANDYATCIWRYFEAIHDGYDSLMTVQGHQGFYWDENQPITYDRCQEKWPRTQTIKKIYEVDSSAFIASKRIYEEFLDRVGCKPYLLDLQKKFNIDIDWPEQFELAEFIFEKGFSDAN